jgi:hypothetical protein
MNEKQAPIPNCSELICQKEITGASFYNKKQLLRREKKRGVFRKYA